MSNFEDKMFECLREAFPHFRIEKQFYINIKKCKFFFDFFIKELNLFIECHGDQHLKFVQHYHGDIIGFNKQKIRDKAKEVYASENNYLLVKFFYNEVKDLTPEYVKEKVYGCIVE